MSEIFLAHEFLEWFNCPLKAYHTHKSGCNFLSSASFFREYIRIVDSFLKDRNTQTKNITQAGADLDGNDLETLHSTSLELIQSSQHPKISGATIIFRNISIFIPYMQWNKSLEGWRIIFPVSSHGIKYEHVLLATLTHMAFAHFNIPIAKVMLSYYHISSTQESHQAHNYSLMQTGYWVDSDISAKIEKSFHKESMNLSKALDFFSSPDIDDESKWAPCHKQYCDQCAHLKHYVVDDVRTLRKSKELIEELQAKSIEKITDIPPDMLSNMSSHSHVVHRQIDSVWQDKPLFVHDEIVDFFASLKYPRHYLDFEAFSTSIPYEHNHPQMKKVWGYIPFLFSLQSQEQAKAPIKTQLWSMMPAKNQLSIMWEELKKHLLQAESIIVYGSQFEIDMIHQLALIHSEENIGASIVEKIVDLQELFFNLSIYHPEQKGKISLKTVTPIWVQGDYESLTVNEGMAANYYFTAMTDNKLQLFDTIISTNPYIARLYDHIQKVENTEIGVKDIALYCKYDTEVMIRIVTKIEGQMMEGTANR